MKLGTQEEKVELKRGQRLIRQVGGEPFSAETREKVQ